MCYLLSRHVVEVDIAVSDRCRSLCLRLFFLLLCVPPSLTLFVIEPSSVIHHDDLRERKSFRLFKRPVVRLTESFNQDQRIAEVV